MRTLTLVWGICIGLSIGAGIEYVKASSWDQQQRQWDRQQQQQQQWQQQQDRHNQERYHRNNPC